MSDVTSGGLRGGESPRRRRGLRLLGTFVGVLLLAGVVAVGVVAFGGFLPSTPDPSGSPTTAAASPSAAPELTIVPTPAPSASESTLPSSAPSAGGSVTPSSGPTARPTFTPRATLPPTPATTPTSGATGSPAVIATPKPTVTPTTPLPTPTAVASPIVSTASPKAPAPVAFRCSGQDTADDPLDRPWKLYAIYSAARPGYDRITLRLLPDETGTPGTARVGVTLRDPDTIEGDLGIPAPAAGDVAVTLRFSDAIGLVRAIDLTPDTTGVRSIVASTDPDGRTWAVLGARGKGCYSLQVVAWEDPDRQATPFVDITLDVER